MKRYYFIDNEIYWQGQKMPPRKVELFNVEIYSKEVYGNDIDGNLYCIDKKELITEEEK